MNAEQYDIVTIGGGLASSALAKVMAEHGLRVLILEREREFKDRVRGEFMTSWGVAEARELGIYELIRDACGTDAYKQTILLEAGPGSVSLWILWFNS